MATTAPATESRQLHDAGHVDVLIVGAGVSGIGAAHHLQERFPEPDASSSSRPRTTAAAPGGPTASRASAPTATCSPTATGTSRGAARRSRPGGEILEYLDEVIDEDDLEQHIRYHHRVTAAPGRREERRWTVEVTRADTGERLRFTTDFLWMCQGYYNHEKPYQPRWEGMDRFQGVIVHPQQWPAGPRLHRQARRRDRLGRHRGDAGPRDGEEGGARDDAAALAVLLLRRADDPRARRDAGAAGPPAGVDARDPAPPVHARSTTGWPGRRWTRPTSCTRSSSRAIRPLLPEGFDVEKHFTPRYRPWQQRIAIVPDGDFFAALREGKASIVTDTIEEFTENGHPGQLRRGARGGHRRHRDRVQPVGRSATSRSPSTARRSTSPSGSPGAAS